MPQYPENCIRGILKPEFVDDDGAPNINLFQFKKREPIDGWAESSINWKDDDNAIDFTLNQTKLTGEIKYEGGVAILSLYDLDRIKKNIGFAGHFKYNRDALPDNRYHGNLLLDNNVSPGRSKMLRDLLAFCAQAHRREDIINQRRNKPRWSTALRRFMKKCWNLIFPSRND